MLAAACDWLGMTAERLPDDGEDSRRHVAHLVSKLFPGGAAAFVIHASYNREKGNGSMSKFRRYRERVAAEGEKPLGYLEWKLGRIAGKLEVAVATLAYRQGDNASLNHVLLSVWAGNQSHGGREVSGMAPHELASAMREGRLRLVVDPGPPELTRADISL